jgi:hypothetical protein
MAKADMEAIGFAFSTPIAKIVDAYLCDTAGAIDKLPTGNNPFSAMIATASKDGSLLKFIQASNAMSATLQSLVEENIKSVALRRTMAARAAVNGDPIDTL